MADLTPKREKFAVLVASGMSQSDAYRSSFSADKSTNKTIWEQSSRIMADSKVIARVKELQDESAQKIMWAREDSIRVLSEIASRNFQIDKDTNEAIPGAMDKDKIAAVKEINAMEGYNKPTKSEHTFVGLAELLSSIPK